MSVAPCVRRAGSLCVCAIAGFLLLGATQLGAQDWTARPPQSLNGAACTEGDGYQPGQVYDAIIVGAGVAGLSAARELDHLNRSTLILEANDRIGGRAFSADIAGAMIDYGGAWLHGIDTNPLTPLVDSLGFHRIRTNLDVPYYVNGSQADAQTMKTYNVALEEYEQALEMAASAGQSQRAAGEYACHARERIKERRITTHEACEQLARAGSPCRVETSAELARLCTRGTTLPAADDNSESYVPRNRAFAEVFPILIANAGPLESAEELRRTSTVDGADFAAGEDDLIDRSMGEFVKALGGKARACLNSPVSRIEYDKSGRVEVTVGSRVYTGKTAVVTVSVGVLKKGKIEFVPSLPQDKLDAIRNLQMGNMQKVIVPFKENVFQEHAPNSWVVYAGNLTAEQAALASKNNLPVVDAMEQGRPVKRIVMAFVLRPLEKNMAIGFFGGDWAKALESQCGGIEHTSGPENSCDAMAVAITRDALESMFTREAVGRAIDAARIHVTRWSLDPTSYGAYSIAGPRMWFYHEILGRPVEDSGGVERLYFAGEGTARPIYNGSYPGAYESGVKAARDLNATLLNMDEGSRRERR
jgi:monoamine oxidase